MAVHIFLLNVTQYIQPGRDSLRRSFFDYGRFSNASILDSIASTIAIVGLNALLLQLIFLVGGLTTHSIALSSMFQGSLISDCIISPLSGKNKSCKKNVQLKLKAVFLVFFVFGAEALLTYCQTSTSYIVSSQDLSLRRVALGLYEGQSRFVDPTVVNCLPLVNASREVSHRHISLCVTLGGAPSIAFVDSGQDFLGVMVNYLFDRKININLITSRTVHTLGIEITLHLAEKEKTSSFYNITKLHRNTTQVAYWLMRRVANLYNCVNVTKAVDVSAMYSSDSCSFGDSSEVATKSFSVILSALHISSELYSLDDFLTLQISSISNWTTHVSPSGRNALLQFAKYERSRVDGGVLWLLAVLIATFALIAGFYAPDYELAKDLAVAEQLEMRAIPLHSPSHLAVSRI